MAKTISLCPVWTHWVAGYSEKLEYCGSTYDVMQTIKNSTFQEALLAIKDLVTNNADEFDGTVILRRSMYGDAVHTFSIFDDTEVVQLILSLTDTR